MNHRMHHWVIIKRHFYILYKVLKSCKIQRNVLITRAPYTPTRFPIFSFYVSPKFCNIWTWNFACCQIFTTRTCKKYFRFFKKHKKCKTIFKIYTFYSKKIQKYFLHILSQMFQWTSNSNTYVVWYERLKKEKLGEREKNWLARSSYIY
jgi:hypothetical protein